MCLLFPENRHLRRCMRSKGEVSNSTNRESYLRSINYADKQLTVCILIWTLANEKLRILFTFLGSLSAKIGKKTPYFGFGKGPIFGPKFGLGKSPISIAKSCQIFWFAVYLPPPILSTVQTFFLSILKKCFFALCSFGFFLHI